MKQLILFSTMLLTVIACDNAKHEDGQGHNHGQETVTPVPVESHKGTSDAVTLDKGKKWKANAETTEGVQKMQSITKSAISENKATADVLPSLQQEFKTIFEKCTMTGEAHNQLHNFLIPVKSQLDSLKSETASQKTLQVLEQHLATYPRYFE